VLVLAEAADTEDLIRAIITIDVAVAEVVLIDALTTSASELVSFAGSVEEEGALLVLVVSVVLLEAADSGSLIRSIRALSFAVTELVVVDAFTGTTLELVLSAAWLLRLWAHLVVIDREDASTTVGHDLIGGIVAVADTVAELVLVDALT